MPDNTSVLNTLHLLGREIGIYSYKFKDVRVNLFGYRERIQIERLLFFVLKLICRLELQRNVSGFNVNQLDTLLPQNSVDVNSPFSRIVGKLKEIKIHIKKISSANAYVQSDAIFAVVPEGETSLSYLSLKLLRLQQDIKDYLQQQG